MSSYAKDERKTAANVQKENERNIDRTIEETRDSTRKVIQEAKRELPEFTSAFHDYQEQNITAIREISNNALELQKAVAKSNQAVYSPYTNSMIATMFLPYYYWMLPQTWTDTYARMTSNFAEIAIAATRLSNEMMLASMESTRNSLDYTNNSTQGLVKLYRQSAETADEMSRDLSTAVKRRIESI